MTLLEQSYFVAEIIGAITIIASLIYVGRQVQQNTEMMQVNASQSFVELYNTYTNNLASDSDVADFWTRGIKDFDSLNDIEQARFSALAGQCTRMFESTYIQFRHGALDIDVWEGFKLAIQDVMSQPGIRKWWAHRKHWHSARFVDLINDLHESADVRQMYGFEEQNPDK